MNLIKKDYQILQNGIMMWGWMGLGQKL